MKTVRDLKVSRGLLGEGLAAVIGMPQGFDLARRLSESSHIRLATAFAHLSGWNLISDWIAACPGQVHILAGLHFFQTEPKLLRTWLKRSYQSDKFGCRVVTRTSGTRWTFHPKVLIVSGKHGGDFAVVGSGNLSVGGLRDNVECSLFTEDQELVSDLSAWFEQVSRTFAVKLEEPVIRRYEPLYEKYQSRLRRLTQQESFDLGKIDKEIEAKLHYWEKAVSDAKAFFESAKFVEQWKQCQDAIRKIRASLNYPRFTFNYDGWQEFLNIRELGNLARIQQRRQKLSRKLGKIGNAFRVLIDDSRPELPRLEEVFSGANKVDFIGRNVLTKVLAAHDGKSWPVYNARVEGVLRQQYGYWIPRGLTEAQKYLAYARLMREFAAETGAGDVYALDRFFLYRSQQG
jgi:HKD family nuclease